MVQKSIKSGSRIKANIPKAGVTKNRRRRYDNGGKAKHKQG